MALTKSLAVGTAVGTFGAVVAFAAITGSRTDAAPVGASVASVASASGPRVTVSTPAATAATVFADCVAPAVLEGGACVTHVPGPIRTVVRTGSVVAVGSGSSQAGERSAAPRAKTTTASAPRRSAPAPGPTRAATPTIAHHDDEHSDDHGDDHGDARTAEPHKTEKPQTPETHEPESTDSGH